MRSASAGAVPVLIATAALFTGAGAAQAADGGGGDLPSRIYAVPESDQECVKPSSRAVTVSSAAQRILTPALSWQLTRGAGVTVAILDTGMDVKHSSQLAGQVTMGPDEVGGGRTRADCIGHGTFVAGLIAARPKSGTTVVGIAPQAHVYAVTVTDRTGATSADILAKGIDHATDAGARIIDVSVVSSRSSPRLVKAVRRAVDHGVLVLAPAVADDQSLDGPVYPAALPGVISVSNSSVKPKTDVAGGAADTAAEPVLPSGRQPQLSAPGDVVLSVGPGGGAFVGSGAAYSTALVAGTAALMDSYHPRLTLAQRTERLIATAYPASGESGQTAPVIDPYAAITTLLPAEYGGGQTVIRPGAAVTPLAPPRIDRTWSRGLLISAFGALAVLVGLGTKATVRAGRVRRWRPTQAS